MNTFKGSFKKENIAQFADQILIMDKIHVLKSKVLN